MSTITREQLRERAREKVKSLEFSITQTAFADSRAELEEELELARIALASLEAEPVSFVMADDLKDSSIISTPAYRDLGEAVERTVGDVVALYAAPPASVTVPKVPSSVTAETCNLDELGHDWNEAEYYAQGWNACRDAMIQGAEPVTTGYKLPEETGSSLQLRNLIRQRHAEWSQATFGDVGPIGPLKHLSKEALEAAAEPEDLSEWADMQFLLWDAQRRAGISDGEITAAMEEKLKVNMARQWPEPKDGEPRLHIKAAPQQEVK